MRRNSVENSLGVNQTCGQAAIAFLEASGVDTVFGIPGVHTLDLYKGLAESSIRHIGVRHEQGAGSWPTAMPAPRASPAFAS